MAEAVIFHYRDADNVLVRLNPNTKLVALLAYSAIVSSAPASAVFPLILIPLGVAFAIKLPWRTYLKESIFFIVLAVLMAMTSFVSQRDVVVALSSTLSFLSMVLASILLTDTTMPDELSRSLGSALSHIIGKSGYALSAVFEITLSMIPLIIDSTIGIFEARKARGASFIAHPIKAVSELSVSILSDLLDKAEIYIDALYSRGYDASKRRSAMPYRICDAVIIAVSLIAVVMNIIMEVL